MRRETQARKAISPILLLRDRFPGSLFSLAPRNDG